MNYAKIYQQLINKAKKRNCNKSKGFEQHHILPRSMGGDDSLKNLTYLTYKEHYVAHHLLTKIYPGLPKLAQAFIVMINGASNKYSRHKGKISAREHAKLKTLARPVLINSGYQQLKLNAGIHALGAEKTSQNGQIGGTYSFENNLGIHSQTLKDKIELGKRYGHLGGKIAGVICREKRIGVCSFTSEQNSNFGKIGGNKTAIEKLGLHALTEEDLLKSRSKGGKISGERAKQNKTGIHAIQNKELEQIRKKAGQANKNKAWQEWYESLERKELSLNFRPTRRQSIQYELKWYWNSDKLCSIHPEEEGRRRTNKGACCACGK